MCVCVRVHMLVHMRVDVRVDVCLRVLSCVCGSSCVWESVVFVGVSCVCGSQLCVWEFVQRDMSRTCATLVDTHLYIQM